MTWPIFRPKGLTCFPYRWIFVVPLLASPSHASISSPSRLVITASERLVSPVANLVSPEHVVQIAPVMHASGVQWPGYELAVQAR